jgi:hypothetical protein
MTFETIFFDFFILRTPKANKRLHVKLSTHLGDLSYLSYRRKENPPKKANKTTYQPLTTPAK